MKKQEPVSHIMSSDVYSIQVGQSPSDARKLMMEHGTHHVPVVDGKQLIGLISFTDLMKVTVVVKGADDVTLDALVDQQFTVNDVMSTELVTLNQKDTIREAARILSQGQFHSLPVVNDDNDIVGMVTSTDLIRFLSDLY